MFYNINLESICLYLKRLEKSVSSRIIHSDSNLMISKGSEGIRFIQVTHSNGMRVKKGISHDTKLIYSLANEMYLRQMDDVLLHNINIISEAEKNLIDFSPDSILERLPKNFDILDKSFILEPDLLSCNVRHISPISDGSVKPCIMPRIIEAGCAAAWAAQPYCANTSYSDFKCHTAVNGIMARSKSEVSIIGLYEAKKIPYHYDELVLMESDRKLLRVSPDFIGVRKDGTLVIHEHAGVMNSPDYRRRLIEKLQIYGNAGFYCGRNLLLTFDDENGGLNLKLISDIMDDFYKC